MAGPKNAPYLLLLAAALAAVIAALVLVS